MGEHAGVGFGPAHEGALMKKLGIAMAIGIAAVGAAHAADLPTTKPAAPPPVNCFSSLWAYINSNAGECPLTYGPFTAYLTLDWGFGWESHGAGYNPAFNNGVSNIVTKQSGINPSGCRRPTGSISRWSASRSASHFRSCRVRSCRVGRSSARRKWNTIPDWGYLADAQRAQVQNNGKALTLQNAAPI